MANYDQRLPHSISEAYLIETGWGNPSPLREPNLMGNGPAPSSQEHIDVVGRDFCVLVGPGTCGKNGQSVITRLAIPTLRSRPLIGHHAALSSLNDIAHAGAQLGERRPQ